MKLRSCVSGPSVLLAAGVFVPCEAEKPFRSNSGGRQAFYSRSVEADPREGFISSAAQRNDTTRHRSANIMQLRTLDNDHPEHQYVDATEKVQLKCVALSGEVRQIGVFHFFF